ncbi:MAG: hypothetical protein JWN32_331, partial [Solirubrobacterales bacterium]|nr:hypothetical protein [Solirubrobacterales bacterium]
VTPASGRGARFELVLPASPMPAEVPAAAG